MTYTYVEIPVMLEFPTEPAAIMNYTVQGRGDVLPVGAMWVGEGPWWTRPPTRENIQRKIDERSAKRNAAGELIHKEAPVRWTEINPVEIPQDRTYRNALCCVDGRVQHDMVKAREWHRAMLRHERARKFLELDGARAVAVRSGDTQKVAAIDAEAQKWADAPADPRIEAARNVAELKQLLETPI